MTILEKYTDMAGKIRILCQLTSGETVSFKFQSEPTVSELNDLETKYIEQNQYINVSKIEIDLLKHHELIREFVTLVKKNPSVTFNQYNNWLATKKWYESSIIRYFVFSLATELSGKSEVNLSDFNETQVLGKLRDWIANTPAKKIEKVIFNL